MVKAMNIYVDLDGTLVKSDLLVEGIFALIKQQFMLIFMLPFWLLKGKAYFKNSIFYHVDFDFSALPYSSEFVDYLKRERSNGRKIILATGNCLAVAEAVQRNLPIFDGIMATEEVNLTGPTKLEKIRQHAEGQPFSYAGNSSVDQEILEAAEEPVLVNPTSALRKKWKSRQPHKIFDSKTKSFFRSAISAMRVHQWTKNTLLLVPLLLSHQANNIAMLIAVIAGFLAFSLIASGTYLFNDLLDISADRQHPVKKHRPFASAELSVFAGCYLIVALVGSGFLLAYWISLDFLLMCGVYLVGTLAYSFVFKSYIILDAINLAGLYTVRLLAGAVISNTELSFWLLSFSMFIFLSLAFIKRCTELAGKSKVGERSLHGRDYGVDDLSNIRSMGIASGFVSILVVAMYINSEEVVQTYRQPQLLWLICPVLLYWLMRLWIKMDRGEMHVDPVVYSIKDRTSILCGLSVVMTIFAAV